MLVFGGTGTAGQGAVRALVAAGHEVRCFVRPGRENRLPKNAEPIVGDLSNLERAFDGSIDAVVSCLASRSGTPVDAWAIDHDAHLRILRAAKQAGVSHFVQLSALCVQKPVLAFQHAKLAFEQALMASDLDYSIVRPTAFFKSLSGQVARVQDGKAFLVFGDGLLTACKPISDDDLGRFIAKCLLDPALKNKTLPVGGPGPAITPLDQGNALFERLGETPRFKHVPVGMMNAIIAALRFGGVFNRRLAEKAELAKIGRYYATESMLIWDEASQRYNSDATPEFGTETLFDYYDAILSGKVRADLGAHAVF